MEYPKIHSLWKREGWYFDEKAKQNTPHELQGKRQSFIIGDYAEPEFANIKKWRVEEKIDGTNIRILWNRQTLLGGDMIIRFGGRTKDAQIPCHLLEYLQNTFTPEVMEKTFPFNEATTGVMFGEGYGPKIQKGGERYRNTPGFILFDVYIGGWWLKRDDVKNIADKLGIEATPDLGIWTEEEIIEYVKSQPISCLQRGYGTMEGVVCRPEPLILFRRGIPIMFKLKCKEFV